MNAAAQQVVFAGAALCSILAIREIVLCVMEHVKWKRELAAHEAVYQFWTAQCHDSLKRMEQARLGANWSEYAKADAAFRVNLRRYEQEVLGKVMTK